MCNKLIEGFAPAFVESHFFMLFSTRFVLVDDERGVLSPFLMAFKENDRCE